MRASYGLSANTVTRHGRNASNHEAGYQNPQVSRGTFLLSYNYLTTQVVLRNFRQRLNLNNCSLRHVMKRNAGNKYEGMEAVLLGRERGVHIRPLLHELGGTLQGHRRQNQTERTTPFRTDLDILYLSLRKPTQLVDRNGLLHPRVGSFKGTTLSSIHHDSIAANHGHRQHIRLLQYLVIVPKLRVA